MKKSRNIMLGLMLVFTMALMTACSSGNNETTKDTTMAPTTKMESTGVIDGMADDVKKGAGDVVDDVEGAMDMTNGTVGPTAGTVTQ